MVFTPLISPAVTPLDTQFRMPDYAVPGEYFSPLSSPALQAQIHTSQRSVYGAGRGPDSSETTSPIDATFEKGSTKNTPITSISKRAKRNSFHNTNKLS